jgi:hypothetical protein
MGVTTMIYVLIDPRTSRGRYVGKTIRPMANRLYIHVRDAKRGDMSYRGKWIRSLLSSGMKPKMYLLETAGDNWAERERFWIKLLRSKNGSQVVNATEGGEGTPGNTLSPEHRAKISAAQKGKKRRPLTEEHRRKISLGNMGKPSPKSPEQREKIRQSLLGRKNQPHSAETKEKIAAAHRGKPQKPMTPEQKAGWVISRQHLRGEGHPMAKLTRLQADAIRLDKRKKRIIAAEYGICEGTVKSIRSGKIWK